ncbi:MAG: FHA domain-containing protein [Aliarcobacter sp.]|nr:FHA domain-containing protein [Aliarcobacter sp.]
MIKLKSELIDSFVPNAVLIPLTNEAKNSIVDTKIFNKVISMFHFPFRVGRESRTSENEKGLFVKLRIFKNESTPNNDIYLINCSESLEISKEHFQIEKKDRDYFIKDRNSTLGTKLNNQEIGKKRDTQSHLLKDGDIIKIGSSNSKYEFQFLILK